MSQCQNCAALHQEINYLQNEIARLQLRIDTAGNYCRSNVSQAQTMLQAGNLGMRTYGRNAATVEHLSFVAVLLGIGLSDPVGTPFKGFRGFTR